MIEIQPLKFINKEEFLKRVFNKKLKVFTRTKDERLQFVLHLIRELGFDNDLASDIMDRAFFYFNPSSSSIHNIRIATGSIPSNFKNKLMEEILFDDLLANNNKQEIIQDKILELLTEEKRVLDFDEINSNSYFQAFTSEEILNALDYLVDKKLLKEVIENNETKYTLK